MTANRKESNGPRDFATETIENFILESGLHPGDRLPSEREMCARWGFSRATLHSAIRRLIERSVLTSRVGSGTFVATPRPSLKLQAATSFIDSVHGKGYTPGARVIYKRIERADSHVSGKLGLDAGTTVFTMCRLRLMDNVPASLETTFVDYGRCGGIEGHDFSVESFYQVLREEYGVIPVHGTENLSITFVTAVEARLLGVDENVPAFYQSAVMTDSDGSPLEYFRSTVLPRQLYFTSRRQWRK
jgi:GntR family transcriptional regulator